MESPILSKKTLNDFREFFVSDGTIRTISDAFDAADIPWNEHHQPNVSGQRRTLVEQYYSALDLTKAADARKLLSVFESVLSRLEDQAEISFSSHDKTWSKNQLDSLSKSLRRDGYIYKNGVLCPGLSAPSLDVLNTAAIELDAEHLLRQIRTIREQIDINPGLAIGSSKELLETVCKTILSERKICFDDSSNVPKLMKLVARELQLTRDDIPDAAKGAETIKRVLSSLSSVVQGIAELRNLYGTGHGKHASSKGLQARHARLVVGAATAAASFLFETHQERESK